MKIYDLAGDEIFKTLLYSASNSIWVSDIDKDEKVDILHSTKLSSNVENIFIIKMPNAGSSVGWPGQQGNIRNTGVLEQPAYFAPTNDTIYWMNTISLSPNVNNIIPIGLTVIIKPGTRIVAHGNASLIVKGTLLSEGSKTHPIVFSADINDAEKGYWQGISIANYGKASFNYCEVKDSEIGILCEDKSGVLISNCTIRNNEAGIVAFNSLPDIKTNLIKDNTVGIGSYKNAMPILSDVKGKEPYNNAIINNNTGIEIDQANVVLDNGYNDIYNPGLGFYINFLLNPGPNYLKATKNYWGTTSIPDIYENLNPPQSFIIEPICENSQTPYSAPIGDAVEMLISASTSMEDEDYPTAENTFKAIIDVYPESPEAYFSVGGLFSCTEKSEGNWDGLETYYNGLYNDSTLSNEFHKLVFGYINLCKRTQEKFAEAITNYESIILDNPTYNDSVYAVIDIGNTYEEAGNYKSSLGQLSQYIPASLERHVEKSVDLLLSLHLEDNHNTLENSNLMSINAYPNPVKGNLIVEYELSVGSNVGFSIYDILGKEVMRKNEGFKISGQYVLDFDMSELKPGVYYLSVSLEGNQAYNIKIIKR